MQKLTRHRALQAGGVLVAPAISAEPDDVNGYAATMLEPSIAAPRHVRRHDPEVAEMARLVSAEYPHLAPMAAPLAFWALSTQDPDLYTAAVACYVIDGLP